MKESKAGTIKKSSVINTLIPCRRHSVNINDCLCFPESSWAAQHRSDLVRVFAAWQQIHHRLAQLRLHHHGAEPRPGAPRGPTSKVVSTAERLKVALCRLFGAQILRTVIKILHVNLSRT